VFRPLQKNRFEFKFLVSEAQATAIRDFARSYLVRDEFADPRYDYAYPIHSVYLDSPDLHLCRSTCEGQKNRFKLRVRYYDEYDSNPVFFEIKRRVTDAILKQRAAVRRDAALRLIDGHDPRPDDLLNPDDLRAYDSLQQFCDLRRRIDGQPKVIVSYLREAWVTPTNNSVRLTLDRSLAATLWTGKLVAPDLEKARNRPQLQGVILELKFTDRFPNWMAELAQIFNLRRRSVPKYVECVQVLDLPEAAAFDRTDTINSPSERGVRVE